MPITWKPTPGQGYCKKLKLIGAGQEIDEINCIIKTGTFIDGELHGSNNIVIDYSDSANINIRMGSYINGKENGDIYEYVFSKSQWNTFHGNINGVLSTRYKHTFIDGDWAATTETISNKRIKGICSKEGSKLNNWTSFTFIELP